MTDKKQYPSEQYLDLLIANMEFAAMAPIEVVRVIARELKERRKAEMDSELVGEFYEDGPLNWYQISDGDRVPAHRRIPLYRHAQQPIVPDEVQSRAAFEKWCQVNIERNKWHPEFYAYLPAREQWTAWEACRAAMLAAAPQEVKGE